MMMIIIILYDDDDDIINDRWKFFALQTKSRSVRAIDEATFPSTIAPKPVSCNFENGPNK